MPKWHIYENSDEIVIVKNRKSKVIVCIPLNYDNDYYDKDTGKKVEYSRRMEIAKKIVKALSTTVVKVLINGEKSSIELARRK